MSQSSRSEYECSEERLLGKYQACLTDNMRMDDEVTSGVLFSSQHLASVLGFEIQGMGTMGIFENQRAFRLVFYMTLQEFTVMPKLPSWPGGT